MQVVLCPLAASPTTMYSMAPLLCCQLTVATPWSHCRLVWTLPGGQEAEGDGSRGQHRSDFSGLRQNKKGAHRWTIIFSQNFPQ